MFKTEGQWVLSPSDLVDALECEHRLALSHAAASRLPGAPEPDRGGPSLVAAHGDAHEQRELERLRGLFGDGVAEIGQPAYTAAALAAAAAQTGRAMSRGAPVVYQAVLFDGGFYGRVDFLVNSRYDPDTGAHDPSVPAVYEPYDTKLARRARPAAVLQIAAYAAALVRGGHAAPERMHLRLGDGKQKTLRVADYLPVVGPLLAEVEQRVAAPAALPADPYGEKRAACETCPFQAHCAKGREDADDLALVAGIRADQRRKLIAAGITTVAGLGAAADDERPPTLAAATFDALRAQAAIQAKQDETRTADDPVGTVLLDVFSPDGLAAMPDPSPGDVYFDMEGDPFALGGNGLEYLFGAVTADGGTSAFTAYWGHDRAGERDAFEQFVDFAVDRIASDPGAHIYHYAPYEPTALKRLAADYGTREAEIDGLLRGKRLVDLYSVVRRSVRISQRSYSIKYVEPLYMTERRDGGVTTAFDSIEQYEQYLLHAADGDIAAAQAALDDIAVYNRYDCDSTLGLHRMLLRLRDERGIRPAGPPPEAAAAAPSQAAEKAAAAAAVADELLAGLPEKETDFDDADRARWLIAGAAGYHRRENNPDWWDFYRLLGAPLSDLENDTGCAVPVRVDADEWQDPCGKQTLARRDLAVECDPDRPHPFSRGESVRLLYPDGPGQDRRCTNGKVETVDGDTLGIVETAPVDATGPDLPVAVLPGPPVDPAPKDAAVLDLARQVSAALPALPRTAALDLLRRRPPRLAAGVPLPRPSAALTAQDAVVEAVLRLDGSYLAVQGPPGSGKTHLAGVLIRTLVGEGKTVGVVSTSHKAVENALTAAVGTRDPEDPAWQPAVPAAKKPKGKAVPGPAWEQPGDLRPFRAAHPDGHVVGGTAWTFASPAFRDDPLDFLIVDEAGQFALADLLADAGAARNLVLLGDPQQLPQVVRGTHPAGVDASVLGHVVAGDEVLDERFGYFLYLSRRMHPEVCAPVSDLAYRGLLRSHPSASARRVAGVSPGLHLLPVAHEGNRTCSPEEAAAVVAAAAALIGRGWHDHSRPDAAVDRTVDQADVVVVAPFNRQVRAIKSALAAAGLGEVRVGTVDRYQGQEAAVVIASLTASSGEDLPRGLDFLLSTNRLNVALSRAQAVAVLVCNPVLARTAARTVPQMRLLAGLAGLLAAARAFPAVPAQRADVLFGGPPCNSAAPAGVLRHGPLGPPLRTRDRYTVSGSDAGAAGSR